MLVLSRSAKQKILFPNLGIAIKVIDIKGKNVRLGVNAPKEIRVLREELAGESSFYDRRQIKRLEVQGRRQQGRLTPELVDSDTDRIEVLVRQLDTANLALHLAQNQLRQGRSDYAEASLQHAIDCLNEMEVSAGLISYDELHAVRETSAKYRIGQKTALILGGDQSERRLVMKFLRHRGIEVSQQDSWSSLQLLDAIQSNCARPDLILLLEPRRLLYDIHSPLLLKLGTLDGLTQKGRIVMEGQVAALWMLDDSVIPEGFELINGSTVAGDFSQRAQRWSKV